MTRLGSADSQGQRPSFQQRAKKQFQALIGTKKSEKGRSSDSEDEASATRVEDPLPKQKAPYLRQASGDSVGVCEVDSIDRSSTETTYEVREEAGARAVDIEWHAGGVFKIAGHTFRKAVKLSKDDCCSYCGQGVDAFHTQGHKCVECKQIFHTKCIQNGGVQKQPCRHSSGGGKPGRRKHRKRSSGHSSKHNHNSSNFNLQGITEFMDSTDKIIASAKELQMLQEFITEKVRFNCYAKFNSEGFFTLPLTKFLRVLNLFQSLLVLFLHIVISIM